MPKGFWIFVILEQINFKVRCYLWPSLFRTGRKPLADFCRAYDAKLVIPFSISGNDVETNPNIFQYIRLEARFDKQGDTYQERFQKSHHQSLLVRTRRVGWSGFTTKLEKTAWFTENQVCHLTSLKIIECELFQEAFWCYSSKCCDSWIQGKVPQLNEVFNKLWLSWRSALWWLALMVYNQWFCLSGLLSWPILPL